jgi:hypothetical protein
MFIIHLREDGLDYIYAKTRKKNQIPRSRKNEPKGQNGRSR